MDAVADRWPARNAVAVREVLGDTRRVKSLVLLIAVAGCGSESESSVNGCVQLAEPATFSSGRDFASAEPGTLAGWDPDGRWWMLGARFGRRACSSRTAAAR